MNGFLDQTARSGYKPRMHHQLPVVSRSSKRLGTCACVLEDVDVSEIARLFALVKI